MQIKSINLSVASIINTSEGSFLKIRIDHVKHYYRFNEDLELVTDKELIEEIEYKEEIFERLKYK